MMLISVFANTSYFAGSFFFPVFFCPSGRASCTELSQPLDYMFLCWLASVSQAPQKALDPEPIFPFQLGQNVGSFRFVKRKEKKKKTQGAECVNQ